MHFDISLNGEVFFYINKQMAADRWFTIWKFFFYSYFVTLNSYTESEIGRIFSKDKIAEEYLHFPSILPAGAEI